MSTVHLETKTLSLARDNKVSFVHVLTQENSQADREQSSLVEVPTAVFYIFNDCQ